MILRGQNTEALRDDPCHAIHHLYIFVRKVRYLPMFNCELLIFEILKMISIHASLCGIIIIARKFALPLVCLCPIKMKETRCLTRNYLVLL